MCLNWCDTTPVQATSSLGLVEAKEEKSACFKPNLIFAHTPLSLPHEPHVISGRGKSLICKGAKAGEREK